MKHVMWLRQDVRMADNIALSQACQSPHEGVIALYVLTPKTWQNHHWAPVKVDLLLRQLACLSQDLATCNIPLKILTVPTFADVPDALATFCQEHDIGQVFANQQYLVDEMHRDQQVEQVLQKQDVTCQWFHDAVLMPPQAVLKQDGTPFKVFTPYKRALLQQFSVGDWAAHPTPNKQPETGVQPDPVLSQLDGFISPIDPALWPVGEQAIHMQLQQFCQHKVSDYKSQRDFPIAEHTSKLSPYLALGMVSIRQCVRVLMEAVGANTTGELVNQKEPECWFSELIWREFYIAIAWHFPQVVKGKAFQPHTEALPWSYNEDHFVAWCEGRTGFPFVDAAMRQLKQVGWMHNRLRMVVAMFLTKTLFIDWRWGERFFMENLVDGDFASNNGGWQWSASTGTDAAPYFRIYNPTTQSERFDPDGDFMRFYCPELAKCTNKEIHNPSSAMRKHCGYPDPIVDYSAMRQKVIATFKALPK